MGLGASALRLAVGMGWAAVWLSHLCLPPLWGARGRAGYQARSQQVHGVCAENELQEMGRPGLSSRVVAKTAECGPQYSEKGERRPGVEGT